MLSSSIQVMAMGQSRPHCHPIPKPQPLCPGGVCCAIYIPSPRVTQTNPILQEQSLSQTLLFSGTTFPKFPLRTCRHRVTLPAMRENPTLATGPVSIKHVRNTVPTTLQETTASAVSSTQGFSGGYAHPSPTAFPFIPSNLQLEEPSL